MTKATLKIEKKCITCRTVNAEEWHELWDTYTDKLIAFMCWPCWETRA